MTTRACENSPKEEQISRFRPLRGHGRTLASACPYLVVTSQIHTPTFMSIQIEGLAELSTLLTEQTPRAAKRYLSRCADPAAQVVLDAMKQTVPVGVGILEEELTYSKSFDDVGEDTVLTVNIGPKRSAFWGSLQEFGTRFQQGQHWMGRAWESCKDKCLDVFATEAIGILQDLENKTQ